MLETMNEYQKESQKEIQEDEKPKDEMASKEPTMVDSMYAKLQSGLTVVSNMNLKTGLAALSQEDDESYIPEEDEANQSILESALYSSTKDPMQAHSLDQDEVRFVLTKFPSFLCTVWKFGIPSLSFYVKSILLT